MSDRPSCLLADDHPALVAAVADFLEEAGYEVVGPARNGAAAVELAREHAPDLGLIDYRMPRLSGTDLLSQLRAAAPETALVVYTADADAALARGALAAGAAGVVLKEAPLADVSRALDAVRSGRTYLDPGIAQQPTAAEVGLTDRELEVLALVADGLSLEEIGGRLGIGGETVRTHLRKACARLGASGRTQAVATALRLGLIA